MRDLLGRHQRPERRRRQHITHRRLRERTPRREARTDPLAQPRHGLGSADHLDQHGHVSGVEIRLEYRPGAVDELAQRAAVIKQFAVGGHPPRADILKRGHQQAGHRAEVVEDQRLVASGLGRDPPCAGGGESRLAQRLDGRRDERGPRVTHQPLLPGYVLSDRFKRSLKTYIMPQARCGGGGGDLLRGPSPHYPGGR